MQEVDEGDGYSDDDLDALPADAFQELQQNAIRSTQQQDHNEPRNLPLGPGQGLSGNGDSRRGIGNLGASGNAFYKTTSPVHPQQASSDYGDFDDLLDGEIFDAAEEPVIFKERIGGFAPRQLGENAHKRFDESLRPQAYGADLRSLPAQLLPALRTRHGVDEKPQHEDGGAALSTGEGIYGPREHATQESRSKQDLEAQVQEVFFLMFLLAAAAHY